MNKKSTSLKNRLKTAKGRLIRHEWRQKAIAVTREKLKMESAQLAAEQADTVLLIEVLEAKLVAELKNEAYVDQRVATYTGAWHAQVNQ